MICREYLVSEKPYGAEQRLEKRKGAEVNGKKKAGKTEG
jgi:hypothetical protein